MKNDKGMHSSRRTNFLLKELENPLARKLNNRKKLIQKCISKLYPESLEGIPDEKLQRILSDAISLDRKARSETEGEETKKKLIASQKWQIENL